MAAMKVNSTLALLLKRSCLTSSSSLSSSSLSSHTYSLQSSSNRQWSFSVFAVAAYTTNPRNPNASATNEIMRFLRSETDPEKIAGVFEPPRLPDDPVFGKHLDAYRIAVKRLASAKAFHKVDQILENLLHAKRPCTEKTGIRVMKFYGCAAMADRVVRTFHSLQQDFGLGVSTKLFNCFLSALVDAGNPSMAVADFKAESFDVKPDVVTCNVILKALCQMREYEKAIDFLGDMRMRGIEPCLVSYGTIMDSVVASAKSKKISEDDENQLLDRLLDKAPQAIAAELTIRRVSKDGNTDEALRLLNEVHAHGLNVNSFTLQLLVVALCQRNKVEEARQIFERIGKDGNRCATAYNVLTRALVGHGDLDSAIRMCQQMLNMGWIPDSSTLDAVLDSVLKSNQIHSDATRLLVETATKILPFHVTSKWHDKLPSLFGNNANV